MTIVALTATRSLWLSPKVVVSFWSKSEQNINYKLFYHRKYSKPFSEKLSVTNKVKTGSQKVEIILPTYKISRFRLDFGNAPFDVEISDLTIKGRRKIQLDFSDFSYNSHIEKHSVSNKKLKIYSSKTNPFIIYNKDLKLKGMLVLEWLNLIILATFFYLLFTKIVNYLSFFKLEKQSSRIDIVFVAIFTVLLFLPMSYISDKKISKQENRTFAPKPMLLTNDKFNNKFGEQFEKWFGDRFFGRNLLLFIHDNIKYILEPNNGNGKVLIGKDGWLFYKKENGINNFANRVDLPKNELENGLKYLQDIDNWCKKNNKKFYYVIAPDKSKIYGEYYRLAKKERSDKFGIGQQFIDFIHKNSKIEAIYLYETLRKNKNKGLLYYKHDTHWNHLGAYFGYKTLMEKMGLTAKNYTFKKGKGASDMDKMLSISVPEDKTLYNVAPLSLKTYCKEDNDYYTCVNQSGEKRLFILRDSFAVSLLLYMSNDFNMIYAQHYTKKPLKVDTLDFIKANADIVILENVERFVPQILNMKFPKL